MPNPPRARLAHLQAPVRQGQGAPGQAWLPDAAARDAWRYLSLAAPQHHLAEARHVLPALLAGADAQCVVAAQTALADHAELDARCLRLGPALQGLAQDQKRWRTPRA